MKAYRFKRQYSPPTKVVAMFRLVFIFAVISFVLELMALFFPEVHYTFQTGPITTALFLLSFVVVFLLLCANIILWIGMLHFLAKYDGRESTQKLLSALIVFFGLSGGAALYYWFIYRKYLDSITRNRRSPQLA